MKKKKKKKKKKRKFTHQAKKGKNIKSGDKNILTSK